MREFSTFSTEHLLLLLLSGVSVGVLVFYAKSLSTTSDKRQFAYTLAGLIIVQELVGQLARVALHDWQIGQDLLLHMCGLAVLIIPYALIAQKKWAIELGYYWGVGGSIQALITPSLSYALPEYHTVHFFISHTCLLAGAVCLIILTRHRLTWHGLRTAVLATLMTPFAALGCNVFINQFWPEAHANYWYTLAKPSGNNITASMPNWPLYLPIMALMAVVCMLILFLIGPRENRHRNVS